MRTLGVMALALLWCGCAPLALSRKAELREKTVGLRTGMRDSEVVGVLGEPSSRDGVQCPRDIAFKTCEVWVYDPTAGLPAFPQGRLLLVMVPWGEETRLGTWTWSQQEMIWTPTELIP